MGTLDLTENKLQNKIMKHNEERFKVRGSFASAGSQFYS